MLPRKKRLHRPLGRHRIEKGLDLPKKSRSHPQTGDRGNRAYPVERAGRRRGVSALNGGRA